MAAGCGQERRENTPGSGKQRRRRRKKKVAGDTMERHARVRAEDGASRAVQATSSDDQDEGLKSGDGAARRVCVAATNADQDEVSGRGDGAVRQVRVALRDEDKMERRQQSGDGGTWQAPAIPTTAEYE
ncbi:hypothetical protein PR003_g23695 [Phytophthora rubi]|uniref:Uncharacterized protein n=1 Tax=Phytophthora rubi TaxID=129364 RepID=A0A6A4CUJ7_9STRA|nr:hypothetical protein PR002_g25448 [Phytophthora rubi]KAE8976624.1 hypothetical protein PR001_g25363 [Phytophthora rubi]KAE9296675.1 hypothetical protein PR003_g23695 [Phytophthora rubi]